MSSSIAAAPAPQTYTGTAKTLHWLIVLMVLVQYVTKLMPPGALTRETLNYWHVAVGPTILLLMLVRLLWRLTHTPPAPPADLSPGLRLLSRATHWAFYALLILLPIGGWVSLSGFGGHPTLLGLVTLPALADRNRDLGNQAGAIHGDLAWVLLAVIALHILGALYHVAVKKDGVFGRMLPGAPLPP